MKVRALLFLLWIRKHVKALWPFAAAVASALKPELLGGHYTLTQWMAVGGLVAAAFVASVVPNIEGGVGQYAKAIAVVVVAGFSAAQAVAPDGISRADLWTIGAALVAAAGTFGWPTTQPKSVLASGPGFMGMSWQPQPGDHLMAIVSQNAGSTAALKWPGSLASDADPPDPYEHRGY